MLINLVYLSLDQYLYRDEKYVNLNAEYIQEAFLQFWKINRIVTIFN